MSIKVTINNNISYSFNEAAAQAKPTLEEFIAAYKDSAFKHDKRGNVIPEENQMKYLKVAFDVIHPVKQPKENGNNNGGKGKAPAATS